MDVGTGTAAFPCQLAIDWPEAVFDGFDISSALFPAPTTLPSNVHLQLLDARQPIPEALRCQYDLVHVRLISAGLEATEWTAVVQNLARLLKPGGAMQWEECNFTVVQHLPSLPESTFAAARAMGVMFLTGLRSRLAHGWDTLATEMTAAGLEGVQTEIISADRVRATRERLTTNGMMAIFAWARLMAAKKAPGAFSPERLDELEQQAYEDIRSGCYVKFDVHVAWGFRPA